MKRALEWYPEVRKKECSVGKRIGFIMTSVYGGTAEHMWSSIISASDVKTSSLIIFPGGRLNATSTDEYLRNGIYNLASKDNLDGLIAWTSALSGVASSSEVSAWASSALMDVPLVTVGAKIANAPCVFFDAYTGTLDEVNHFIKVHGAKKIAFIRGPENHDSANDRYRAYLDALRQNDIPFCADLVSSPHRWSEGREAVKELIEERGLIPALDFDSLICASDMLLYGAAKYIEELGVNIPETLRVGGFNDSESNHLLKTSISTVRMPINRMAKASLALLEERMSDLSAPIPDLTLPADFIARASCGCTYATGKEYFGSNLGDVKNFISWAMMLSNWIFGCDELEAFINYALSVKNTPKCEEEEKITRRFSNICLRFYQGGGNTEDLIEIFEAFRSALPLSQAMKKWCEDNLNFIILKTFSKFSGENNYNVSRRTETLGRFKTDLLSLRSYASLSRVLAASLPGLGFSEGYLALEGDDDSYRNLVCGYDKDGIREGRELFPAARLLPSALAGRLDAGAWVVEPLISDSEFQGYLLLKIDQDCSGAMIEDVASSISSALKGIALVEALNRAKEIAEAAERASSEFYANISEELREPLTRLKQGISALKGDEAAELLFHAMKAENLLDLILSEKGETELKKSLIAPSVFFKTLAEKHGFEPDVAEGLPALVVDKSRIDRIAEIFSLLIAENSGREARLSVSLRPAGLAVTFSAKGWKPELLKNNPSLFLAEKLVVMHGGTFRYREAGLAILFPWPTLSGDSEPSQSIGYMLFIKGDPSAKLPEAIKSLPQVQVIDEEDLLKQFDIPSSICQIAYDAKGRTKVSGVVLNLLKNHQRTRSLPFLCFNLEPTSLDLWSALENNASVSAEGRIVALRTLPVPLKRFSAFGAFDFFSNEEELLEDLGPAPSLLILDTVDPEYILRLRSKYNYAKSPILIVKDHFTMEEVDRIAETPNLLIANTCVLESDEFVSRLIEIFGGNSALPPQTGAIVKKAIGYINDKYAYQLSRWKIADAVNISEDYLTRIFRREMRISPWDYLIRYRIQNACELLIKTGYTVNEIASRSGFQDQAYFCRVFKRIKGFPPGQLRSSKN